jgi:DNA-binding transcriptional LysR family regulator
MWHLRDLKYFVAVADHRNFTRAAQELFITQPTLSKQVATLERGLGTPLFHREHDGAHLTRAGEALLPYARSILAAAAEAEAALNAATAELTIGFWLSPGNGLLPTVLSRFTRQHPDATVTLRRAEWGETWAGVEDRHSDIGLLWWPEGCSAPGIGKARLAREPVCVMLPASHPLARQDEVSVADIKDETVLDAPPEWRRALNATRMGRLGRGVHMVRTLDETIEYVASGVGVGVVPSSVAAAHMPPTVTARPLRGAREVEFVAVWRPESENLPNVRSLIRCVVLAAREIFPEPGPVEAPAP